VSARLICASCSATLSSNTFHGGVVSHHVSCHHRRLLCLRHRWKQPFSQLWKCVCVCVCVCVKRRLQHIISETIGWVVYSRGSLDGFLPLFVDTRRQRGEPTCLCVNNLNLYTPALTCNQGNESLKTYEYTRPHRLKHDVSRRAMKWTLSRCHTWASLGLWRDSIHSRPTLPTSHGARTEHANGRHSPRLCKHWAHLRVNFCQIYNSSFKCNHHINITHL